jgi:hypothetical protein
MEIGVTGFNKDSINLLASPKGDSLNYRSAPNTTASVLHTSLKGKSAGRTSGDFFNLADGLWWAVVLNSNGQTAYVRNDVTLFSRPKDNPKITEAEAQNLINDLVKSDSEIYHSLLRINTLILTAQSQGKNVDKYKAQFALLYSRLNNRQEKIKTSKLVSFQTGLKKGYEAMQAGFEKAVQSDTYGIMGIGSLTAIIIGAVIGAGIAVAIYFAFKPTYSESQADLKISSTLEKALSTLSPTESKQVKTDLENQIDTAYNQGSTDGTFSGMSKILLPLGLLFGGYILVSSVLSGQRQRKK